MNKILYIIIAGIILAGGGYFYYASQQLKNNNSYTVEKFEIDDSKQDNCNYDFTIKVDVDKLRFKDHTNLNATLRGGSAQVFDGQLNLSRQSLRLIPSEIQEEDCIKEINLNRNDISQFPMELLEIDQLRKINLSENTITAFPSLKEESSIISLKLIISIGI